MVSSSQSSKPAQELVSASRRRPAERKTMIIVSARDLIARSGYSAISMEDVATAVGITPGALYRHFSGRAELLNAVSTHVLDRFINSGEQALLEDRNGAIGTNEMLTAVVQDTVKLGLDEPTLLMAYGRGLAAGMLGVGERDLLSVWQKASEGEIDRVRLVVRQPALMAALATIAGRSATVAAPRRADLLTEASLAVLLAPPSRQAKLVERSSEIPETPRRTGWQLEPSRRDRMLDAAIRLFRIRGFAGTGVDDIGEAVGMSGSGIYRSYASKADILLDVYDRAGARVSVGAEQALDGAMNPMNALQRLALSYASVVCDAIDLIVVTGREQEALPQEERPRLSRRRRAIRDAWVAVLTELDPDLTVPEARLLVAGVFPLANQAALSSDLSLVTPDEVATLMTTFVLRLSANPG
jgi:AcrR family transcriptional regulator